MKMEISKDQATLGIKPLSPLFPEVSVSTRRDLKRESYVINPNPPDITSVVTKSRF